LTGYDFSQEAKLNDDSKNRKMVVTIDLII